MAQKVTGYILSLIHIFVTIDDDEELENVYQALMDLIYEDEEEES